MRNVAVDVLTVLKAAKHEDVPEINLNHLIEAVENLTSEDCPEWCRWNAALYGKERSKG